MATIKKSVGAQWPLIAHFDFTMADAMVNTAGVLTNFKATGSPTFDIMTLPFNSQVVGGDLIVRVASDDTGTATASLGDTGSATRYLNATDLKSAARTALTLTGYKTQGESIRLTVANQNGNATVGDFRIAVHFMVDSRQSENLKTT